MNENFYNEDGDFDFDKAFERDDDPGNEQKNGPAYPEYEAGELSGDGCIEEIKPDQDGAGSEENEEPAQDMDSEKAEESEKCDECDEAQECAEDYAKITEQEEGLSVEEPVQELEAAAEAEPETAREETEASETPEFAVEIKEKIEKKKEKAKKKAQELSQELKEDAEALNGSIQDKKKIGPFSGIRFKITAAFIIPVLLMVALGVISYSRSAAALTASYEETAFSTLDTTAEYMSLVIEIIRSASYDTSVSKLAREYYGKTYKSDSYQESLIYDSLRSEVEARKLGNQFIKNIVFSTNYGKPVSTISYTTADVYEQFKELEIAARVDEEETVWVGYHPEIDALVETKDYAFSIIRKAFNTSYRKVGYVVVDVDYNKICETISAVSMGDNAIVAFITPDGREISYRNLADAETNTSFEDTYIVGTDIYTSILNSEERTGKEYVDFEGEEYLLLYDKLETEGFLVVALVPKAYIIADANQIALITAVAVVVTAFIVIIIGLILSTSIGTTIRKIMNGLEKVATGDLTVDIRTRRRDEFKILCSSTNTMIGNIRRLLDKANGVSGAVGESSESVAANSGILLEETKSITSSIAEVEQGIVMQAQDAENCLIRMDDLSKKIEIVTDNTNKIAEIADTTKGIVSDGLDTIEALKSKAKATSEVTSEVITNIEELDQASGSIAKIIGVINDIADQTSLLSLNASIEAARAGDAGRGFAVVADSIRKLADQSLNSVNEIRTIVDKIQKQTVETVNAAKQAEVIVSSQEEALKDTVAVFHDINSHVAGLAENLNMIAEGISEMDSAKKDTLAAIESISAVAEETASSATEVNEAASRQLEAVEKLNNESEGLIRHSNDLVEAIKLFKI